MTQLVANGLALRRGARQILDRIDLQARSGEFIALIGPNGSGKSTLLALLAGLASADAGSVTLDGIALGSIPRSQLAARRAWLPQNARCEWPLAVERMVALGLAPVGGFNRDRVESVLAECDLLALRHQPVTTLSGGELARAMLARALVAAPEMLIVDEPLAGLDPRHAWDAARRLRRLAMEQGKLVIASIHDLNIALRCATRVWALREGRLVVDGSPETALDGDALRELFDLDLAVRRDDGRAYVDFTPAD